MTIYIRCMPHITAIVMCKLKIGVLNSFRRSWWLCTAHTQKTNTQTNDSIRIILIKSFQKHEIAIITTFEYIICTLQIDTHIQANMRSTNTSSSYNKWKLANHQFELKTQSRKKNQNLKIRQEDSGECGGFSQQFSG